MTREDTVRLLTVLRAAYPHSYRGITKEDAEAVIALWTRLFAADDPALVSAAVDALLATRTVGYSPTPGEVREQMQRLTASGELDEASAWALVSRACSNGIYGYKEEFSKLPPEVQAVVGDPAQLREWAMMDSETVQSVIASNFQRNYRARQARRKELEKLPPGIRSTISGIADHMMIGGD